MKASKTKTCSIHWWIH